MFCDPLSNSHIALTRPQTLPATTLFVPNNTPSISNKAGAALEQQLAATCSVNLGLHGNTEVLSLLTR